MARIQPDLTPVELTLVDKMAELTGSKRAEVIKSALTVYHWFVRQALTGSTVVARKPTGEEVALETAELAILDGKGNRLEPEELGVLAKRLAAASNPVEAARIKERLTRGFYGILRILRIGVCREPAAKTSPCSVSSPARPGRTKENFRISVRTTGEVARRRAGGFGGAVVQGILRYDSLRRG